MRIFPETFLQNGGNTDLTGSTDMILEILNFILGIAFGFLHKGKEDYYGLLKNGVIVGLILGIIFVVAVRNLVPGGMSLDFGALGTPGVFIDIFFFVIIFIIGAFVGDWLERKFRKE
jgi:hypothetical protein